MPLYSIEISTIWTQFWPFSNLTTVSKTYIFCQTERFFSMEQATLIAKENSYYNLVLKTVFTGDKINLKQGNIS